jgi:hypothetical protein
MNIKDKKLKPLTNNIKSQATEQKEEVKKEDMYVLVAGSRTLENYELVSKYLDIEFANNGITPEKYNITIVEGEATGVDRSARRYAIEHNYACKAFPAQWIIYGNQAGFLRNKKMHNFISQYPNRLCICFKHYMSHGRGTSHSIELGKKFHTNVIWYDVGKENSMTRTFYNNSI